MAFPLTPSPQGFAPPPQRSFAPLETPLSLAAGQRGRRSLPLSDQQDLETLQGARASPGQKNFCLTPQAATKFFCPPSASSEPDTEMKCQGSPKATAQRLTLTRDRTGRCCLKRGKAAEAFPSCPTASVKMGCRGLCSLLGCGAKPRINEVQRA